MSGKFLLYAQIILIILLFYFGNFASIFINPTLAAIFALGALLGIWSLYNLGLDSYTPFPEPRRGGKHVQSGVYRYIRHPMYTSVLLICLALFFTSPNLPAAIIYLLLIYILDQKAAIEEKYLEKLHPTYKTYIEKTKKFIPFLY